MTIEIDLLEASGYRVINRVYIAVLIRDGAENIHDFGLTTVITITKLYEN